MSATETVGGATTADTILRAAAELLREHPFDDIGYGQLGALAGVSERTVFRQFPTREHLLERLATWISQHGFLPPRFDSVGELRAWIRSAFRAYDESPGQAVLLARAETMAPVGAADSANGTTALADELDRLLLRAAPGLPAIDRRRGVASLLLAAGPTHWARMRSAFDFDGTSSAAVFDTVLTSTLSSLRLRGLDDLDDVDELAGLVVQWPVGETTVDRERLEETDRHDERNPHTTELIVKTFIDLIEELGSDDVSYKLIARRSGLGERTIARYFPTRFDLLVGLGSHLDDQVFVLRPFGSLFELSVVVRESMHLYSNRWELAHLSAETSTRSSAGGPSPRAACIRASLAAEHLSLSSVDSSLLVARLTHVDSAAGWATLARWLGRDATAIADAAAWAVESILDPARDRAMERGALPAGKEDVVSRHDRL